MNEIITVAVAGASGRMGREVVKMVLGDPVLKLAAAVSRSAAGQDAGRMAGLDSCGVEVRSDLESALAETRPDVLVDFTTPHSAVAHTRLAIEYGVRPVMGTTGYTPEDIEELDKLCRDKGIGGLIAPNFSIGAILMMKFAAEAAKYMPHLEIIEYHGDQKLDAPSGTAVKTAELISEARQELRQGNPDEKETIEGSRGGYYNGFRIHSVRLPGVFAQQEVVFGAFGQTLKIRHDSYDRAGYMPGVNTAVKKVMTHTGLVYGFEHYMD
ncbi:4-hydroxy-tetrahydrodipicolinate reductase [Paenibacillus mucilaginosus]|uniref:4-hydroxy-tetrahydrodipicolinate reductase n=1 Tax=Paenibacillus mucilaginosus (strain KNP414) TaxID=1036673 RepID=F8FAX5_PAEMK|nr:4-hydroxy-tetrahydrodipicolinate reductase [Paenibacillus mucilaginosus]AEI41376.1 DapB [Paenibacillus mucilaginosus KNP414]MCG7211205.1 4-hydroxy-tetrahydrodipicolinate reductase [Paenibacillus mucilaginosus]WDM30400.1 4-hydroxy-tetrahydrodipicolinate reductase [Paenibacillus mucilaginosus]